MDEDQSKKKWVFINDSNGESESFEFTIVYDNDKIDVDDVYDEFCHDTDLQSLFNAENETWVDLAHIYQIKSKDDVGDGHEVDFSSFIEMEEIVSKMVKENVDTYFFKVMQRV